MARKPFANVDRAWFRMEHPTNLMMITGVMIFSTPMDMERLKATIQNRLLRFDRFRQRVVKPILPWRRVCWEDDPHFNLNDHVHRIILPPPGDQKVLQEVAGELMSTQLESSKPLWEIHLVERYGSGCALIARLHHAIADGIALVHVLLSLTDTDPDTPWPVATPSEMSRRDRRMASTLWRPVRSTLKATTQVTETLLHESQEMLRDPSHAFYLARLGARGAIDFGRLVLRWPDPKTPFKGQLRVPKRAAWSDPFPLDDVKAAGRAMGGTVNDVLLTAITGALRRYMQSRDEPVDNVNFRAVVPVNLRPLDREPTLGNKFGLVFLSLPIGIADPMDRLYELKRRMDALKDSTEPVVVLGILNAIGGAPYAIQDIVVKIFATKGTAVMTNVPGPKETIYLAGAPLDTIMFWVPQSGRLGLGVSIISYAGQVRVGVAADRGLVPSPEEIVTQFHAEFDALQELSRQMKLEAVEETLAEETSAEAVTEIPPESIAEMTAILKDAIEKVNALIEASSQAHGAIEPDEEAAPAEAPVEERPGRCQALTKAGRQCKNRALPDSGFCRIHQGYETAVTK